MTDLQIQTTDIVARYFEAWNASEDERRVAIDAVFADDTYYCDGAAEAIGAAAIDEMMAGVMTQYPGVRFELASPVDTHHQQARFAFRMLSADDVTMVDGIDAMRFDDGGRITSTLGFFGLDIPLDDATIAQHTFEWQRTYHVSAEQLFAVVSDLDVYASVAPNLSAIDVVSGEGVGLVRQCTNPEGESWRETYSEWAPPKRYVAVVDVATYPPSLAAMIHALELTVEVEPVSDSESTVAVAIDAQLTEMGVQVLVDGGAANALFEPILDGWATHATVS